MLDVIRLGRGKKVLEMPVEEWKKGLEGAKVKIPERLAFMTPDHHRVRNFAARELPRNGGKPLTPAAISQGLELAPEKVAAILDELEKNLFFLVRDEEGSVNWAFTVTSDRTAHRLSFSSGERLYGA
jgi:hypothetical protein